MFSVSTHEHCGKRPLWQRMKRCCVTFLYYNRNSDSGVTERFYTYVIPYEPEKNTNVITYNKQNSGPGVHSGALEVYSFYTKNLKKGVTIYFSKTNDVRNWVVNDLKLSNL